MHGSVISMQMVSLLDKWPIIKINKFDKNMAVRITCITKDNGNHQNPHEGITNYGWVNEQTRAAGNNTRAQMVDFLERQGGSAYVRDQSNNVAYIGVWKSAYGNKYLRTHADGKWTDNLLALPECG